MKILNITFTFLLAAFLLTSCHNAESAISDLKDVITEIDELPDEYTDEDLQKIISEYEAISRDFQKYDYTDEQLEELNELKGKYAAKMTKASLKIVGNSFEEASKQAGSALKGFLDEMEKE